MIKILTKRILHDELIQLCDESFVTFVKIVVDVDKNILAIDGELHADAEAILINQGSKQSNIWGANYYPYKEEVERLEYTALINIRPRDDNPDMEILSEEVRKTIRSLCHRYLLQESESPLGKEG